MTKATWWIAAAVPLLVVRAAHAQPWTTTVVDSGGVGQFTSVVYGTDGFPLISYYDDANGDLKVAHCLDAACTSSTKATIDSAGNVGRDTSIAIGTDGLGIVSYIDVTNARLKVAHCSDAACSSAATVALTGLGPATSGTALAIGADGRPIIAFRNGSVLRIAHCLDAACSDATAVSYPNASARPTITILGNGLPLFTDSGSYGVRIGRCQDVACTTATFLALGPTAEPQEGGGGGGPTQYSLLSPSLTTGLGGRGVLAHLRTTAPPPPFQPFTDVVFRRCQDVDCTSMQQHRTFPLALGFFPALPAVAVGTDDVPVIAWPAPAGLQTAFCQGPTCASAVLTTHPEGREYPSAAMSPLDHPLVAFHDQAGGRLIAAYYGAALSADLSVTVQDTPDPVAPLQTLSYTVSVQNLGPNAARDTVLSVSLPPGIPYRSIPAACSYAGATHTVTCPLGVASGGPPTVIGPIQMTVPLGRPGPLFGTATASSSTADPNPANGSTTVSTQTAPGLQVQPLAVVEGSGGLTTARFEVDLLDDGTGAAAPITVPWTTLAGTATSGDDFLPASGALTFPAASLQTLDVAVVGDRSPEPYETFSLELLPTGALVVSNPPAFIVDDDTSLPAVGEVGHGTLLGANLGNTATPMGPANNYRVLIAPFSSYEVVVDGASGDIAPLGLLQLDPAGTVIQAAVPSAAGGSASLRFENATGLPIANDLVQVRSGNCTTDCGPDDVYRLRAYETTARIPRFNNIGGQTTMLVVQNPSDQPIAANVHYWNSAGARIATSPVTIAPRATVLRSTAEVAPDQGGSITVSHRAPYGLLQGKAVAIEPATGLSFDSPLVHRPR
jgi:uncharacterized repeat protein (TIGR01451 family)